MQIAPFRLHENQALSSTVRPKSAGVKFAHYPALPRIESKNLWRSMNRIFAIRARKQGGVAWTRQHGLMPLDGGRGNIHHYSSATFAFGYRPCPARWWCRQ